MRPADSIELLTSAASSAIQRKAIISAPGDPHEREADEVADRVMRMAAPSPIGAAPAATLQRKCDTCQEEETQQKVQRKAESGTAVEGAAAPPIVGEVLRSGGSPLAPAERAFFEPRFGWDFRNVRVHADARADMSARAVSAKAYTVGQDVVFRQAAFAPGTDEGRRLLAHELAHVVQQGRGGTPAGAPQLQRKSDGPALCGGTWTCAASPCDDPDPGRSGDGGAAASWTLKIMVDIEAPSAEDVGASTVGHTYVELIDSTGRAYTFGFYPDKASGTPDPVFHPVVSGCVVHPDTNHTACVDYVEQFSLTKKEFEDALSFAKTACKAPPRYNLQTWNCTTFAVEVAKRAGKSLPPVRGKVGSGMLSTTADNPNTLFEGLMRRDVGPTYNLTGDTEIRDAINAADAPTIARIPIAEKIRVCNRLLSGWVSDSDIAAIGKVYRNTPGAQRSALKKVLEGQLLDLTDIGQRTQLRVILAGG